MKKIMFNDKYSLTQAVLDGRKTMTRRIIKCPRTFKGEWVYGYYTKELWSGNLLDVITDGANDIPIQVETLGQFTGLCDKNVKEIYEYDIVRVYAKDGAFNIVVKWSNKSMAFMACYVDGNQSPFSWFTNLLVYELEVVGNVFDNPDLIIRNDNGDNIIREKA